MLAFDCVEVLVAFRKAYGLLFALLASALLPLGEGELFASIESIVFDQDGMGTLTKTQVLTLDQPVGTVSNVQLAGGYPEGSDGGTVVAWLENGIDIKAIIYNKNGSGPLTSSGVISVATASGPVTYFQLKAAFPELPDGGAIAVWLENGVDIKAVIFSQNGSGPLTTSGVLSIGTATGTVSQMVISGNHPGDSGYEYDLAVAWLEDGSNINAIAFDYYYTLALRTSGILLLHTATGTVTDLQISGDYGASSGYGSVVAWLEEGTGVKAVTFDYDGTLWSSGLINLGTATGVVTDFQLAGDFPESNTNGAVTAWVENGTRIKAIVFAQDHSDPLSTSGVISLATRTGTVTDLSLSGGGPKSSGHGAVVAWLESGTNVEAITFDYHMDVLTSSGVIDLGVAAGAVTGFQVVGTYPEASGDGAAVAWIESGTHIRAIIFDQSGSGALTTSGIIDLGMATMGNATDLRLAGTYPEYSTGGVAVAWTTVFPGQRAFSRPSNRRL